MVPGQSQTVVNGHTKVDSTVNTHAILSLTFDAPSQFIGEHDCATVCLFACHTGNVTIANRSRVSGNVCAAQLSEHYCLSASISQKLHVQSPRYLCSLLMACGLLISYILPLLWVTSSVHFSAKKNVYSN